MQALISAYARSPFHFARKGALADVRPDALAAQVVTGLLKRTGIDPATLEDVIAGCAYPEAAQGNNIARIVSLLAGLPHEVGGMTVNRFCGRPCPLFTSPPRRSRRAWARPFCASVSSP